MNQKNCFSSYLLNAINDLPFESSQRTSIKLQGISAKNAQSSSEGPHLYFHVIVEKFSEVRTFKAVPVDIPDVSKREPEPSIVAVQFGTLMVLHLPTDNLDRFRSGRDALNNIPNHWRLQVAIRGCMEYQKHVSHQWINGISKSMGGLGLIKILCWILN